MSIVPLSNMLCKWIEFFPLTMIIMLIGISHQKFILKKFFVVYKVSKMYFINQTGTSADDSSITFSSFFCDIFNQKMLKSGSPVTKKEVHTKFQNLNPFALPQSPVCLSGTDTIGIF